MVGGALAACALECEPASTRGRPALIAVAHGSRDPRSAATMSAVVAELAAARPGFDVRLAFLDLSAPSVEQVVDAVAAEGHTHAVVTPLLLGSAFHARVDLPGLLAAAHTRHPQLQLTQAGVLGPDVRLIAALRDRVAEAATYSAGRDRMLEATASQRDGGALASILSAPRDPLGARPNHRLGIAVAAVGSSSPAANARTAEVARRLAALTGHLTEICFATTEPTLPQAISRLRTRGAEDILVAPWFLAPGLLTDRLVAAAPNVLHANVIGPHAALTDIVWDRYDAAIATTLTMSA
ncbi:sirohydrochlorin chelatase [Nocardia suismassiliense]|uniref:sirohydrochlorin chelatase n=1 Tax=Nocardia suismassiliense TaxID=2077092 RepID=UPI000D1FAD77